MMQSKEAKTGALVSIESTIPKKVFDALNHRMHVVHAPPPGIRWKKKSTE
jgi:hypothetical protein